MMVTPMIKGAAIEWVLFFMLNAMALGLMVSYYGLLLGDYIQGRSEWGLMGRSFASELEDRLSVGDEQMTTAKAAEIWNGTVAGPQTHERHNTRFRWIKNSIDNGHVAGAPLNADGRANKDTVVRVADLAAFFRRREWRQLVDRNLG